MAKYFSRISHITLIRYKVAATRDFFLKSHFSKFLANAIGVLLGVLTGAAAPQPVRDVGNFRLKTLPKEAIK